MADKRQFLLSAIVLPSLNNFYIFFRYIGNGPGLTGIVGSGRWTGSLKRISDSAYFSNEAEAFSAVSLLFSRVLLNISSAAEGNMS